MENVSEDCDGRGRSVPLSSNDTSYKEVDIEDVRIWKRKMTEESSVRKKKLHLSSGGHFISLKDGTEKSVTASTKPPSLLGKDEISERDSGGNICGNNENEVSMTKSSVSIDFLQMFHKPRLVGGSLVLKESCSKGEDIINEENNCSKLIEKIENVCVRRGELNPHVKNKSCPDFEYRKSDLRENLNLMEEEKENSLPKPEQFKLSLKSKCDSVINEVDTNNCNENNHSVKEENNKNGLTDKEKMKLVVKNNSSESVLGVNENASVKREVLKLLEQSNCISEIHKVPNNCPEKINYLTNEIKKERETFKNNNCSEIVHVSNDCYEENNCSEFVNKETKKSPCDGGEEIKLVVKSNFKIEIGDVENFCEKSMCSIKEVEKENPFNERNLKIVCEETNSLEIDSVDCNQDLSGHEYDKKKNIEHPVINDSLSKLEADFQVAGDDFDDWSLDESFLSKNLCELDLSIWQRCEVIQVKEISSCKKSVQLRSLSNGAVADCVLQGVWTSMRIEPGIIVSVKAQRENSLWTVDNNLGFCVKFPDILLSPTAIVGSVSCLRQGVLNFLFSKNAHVVDENAKIMTSGCLIHELLQQILTQHVDSPECIAMLVEEILSSSHNIRRLYSSQMSLQEARNEMLKAVPNIQKFCKRYSFQSKENTSYNSPRIQNDSEKDAWEGKIISVDAIEDNFWIPEFGLKGKVDVTITAQEKGQIHSQVMPVELKTGHAKNSIEHRGQVILYCLMSKQVIQEVRGGLLVYLREGFARKVDVGRPEQRDIIMLRNNLVQYLAPFYSKLQVTSADLITLPRPTSNSRICEWCPQRTVCSAFLSVSKEDEMYAKSSAQELRNSSIKHLTSEDINYVFHWCNLLWLEERDKSRNNLIDIWCIPAENREMKGQCLSNLKLRSPVCFKEIDSYHHVFARSEEGLKFDSTCHISIGHTVIISAKQRIAIAFGVIEEISDCTVTIDIPRDLSKVSNLYGDLYSIDIYEPQSYLHWVLGNLAAFLDETEIASNLRRLIIKGDVPSFDSTIVNDETFRQNLPGTLNKSQCHFIKMACAANDYLLLHGLPGTGKSTTIATTIQQLVLRGNSVLLTAHTHSAVDNVLLKLLKLDVPFLRIGSLARVHETLHPWTEHRLLKHCTTPDQLEAMYNKQRVVAATCLGIKHVLFTRRSFDVCIVDESTQVLQPVVIGPLLHAKKFILVGDPEQLPPVVRCNAARKGGLSKCLFTHLDGRGGTVTLDLQYRMNSKIIDLANSLTYNGGLKCANTIVAESTISLIAENIPKSFEDWCSRAVSSRIEDSVLFLDVHGSKEGASNFTNKEEGFIVQKLVSLFVQIGCNTDSIGVIAPYNNQVKYIKSIINFPGTEVSTVDQYQGRDKDIVIFSCTNNWSTDHSSNTDSCILSDKKRLTVAITRAKYKLILIGSVPALQCFQPLKYIIDCIGSHNTIQVPA